MGKIVSKSELAKIMGKDDKTIYRWMKEGLPVDGSGSRGVASRFDTQKVIEWLIARSNNGKELDAAKLRLIAAQARKAELEADVLDGALIPEDRVEAIWTKMIALFRAKALALPTILSPQIAIMRDQRKIEKLMKASISEALQEMADYDHRQYRPSGKDRAKGSEDRSTTA